MEPEARRTLMENALSASLDISYETRNETSALRFILFALVDNLRPDEPTEAKVWLDRMEEMASLSMSLNVDLNVDRMIETIGLDEEAVAAAERDRNAMGEHIGAFFESLRDDEEED